MTDRFRNYEGNQPEGATAQAVYWRGVCKSLLDGEGVKITLTRRQRECLRAIKHLTATRGEPPTFQEVADHIGLKKGSIEFLVKRLEERGRIIRQAGRKRSITVID